MQHQGNMACALAEALSNYKFPIDLGKSWQADCNVFTTYVQENSTTGLLMASGLGKLMDQYRAFSQTEREKSNYFDRLGVAFIKNDPGIVQEYEVAWLLSDWAKIRGEGSYCAFNTSLEVKAVASIRSISTVA